MHERFNEALKVALKSQDKVRISTLRLINAAIKDRDIADRTDNGGAGVSEDVVLEILAKMIKQRQESLSAYEKAGRLDLADQERSEIVIIQEFMPRQLEDDEIIAAVDAALAEVGAETLKDMGKVMGLLKQKYTGQMDFGKAGARVKEKLG
ncbi:MAG: GatB/YqeY domain-containing protein [Pseudomonadota bacterium]|nr:GatB/YqeY domain-containing protein [Pseudomonadota bacterium]